MIFPLRVIEFWYIWKMYSLTFEVFIFNFSLHFFSLTITEILAWIIFFWWDSVFSSIKACLHFILIALLGITTYNVSMYCQMSNRKKISCNSAPLLYAVWCAVLQFFNVSNTYDFATQLNVGTQYFEHHFYQTLWSTWEVQKRWINWGFCS